MPLLLELQFEQILLLPNCKLHSLPILSVSEQMWWVVCTCVWCEHLWTNSSWRFSCNFNDCFPRIYNCLPGIPKISHLASSLSLMLALLNSPLRYCSDSRWRSAYLIEALTELFQSIFADVTFLKTFLIRTRNVNWCFVMKINSIKH